MLEQYKYSNCSLIEALQRALLEANLETAGQAYLNAALNLAEPAEIVVQSGDPVRLLLAQSLIRESAAELRKLQRIRRPSGQHRRVRRAHVSLSQTSLPGNLRAAATARVAKPNNATPRGT